MIEPFIVATAAFRRLVWRWAKALIEQQEVITPQAVVGDLRGLFDKPFSADELGLGDDPEGDDQRLRDASSIPLDLDGLAEVFCSLEASLVEAADLFLSVSAQDASASRLATNLEAESERSDFRMQRLIAEVYSERRSD